MNANKENQTVLKMQSPESQNSSLEGSTTSLNSNASQEPEGFISKDILREYLKKNNQDGFKHKTTDGYFKLTDNQLQDTLNGLEQENITIEQLKEALKNALKVTTDGGKIHGIDSKLYNAIRSDLLSSGFSDMAQKTKEAADIAPIYATVHKKSTSHTDIDDSKEDKRDKINFEDIDSPPEIPQKIEELNKQKIELLGNTKAVLKDKIKEEKSKHWPITNFFCKLFGITTIKIDEAKEMVQKVRDIDTSAQDASNKLNELSAQLNELSTQMSNSSIKSATKSPDMTLSSDVTTSIGENTQQEDRPMYDNHDTPQTTTKKTEDIIYTTVEFDHVSKKPEPEKTKDTTVEERTEYTTIDHAETAIKQTENNNIYENVASLGPELTPKVGQKSGGQKNR